MMQLPIEKQERLLNFIQILLRTLMKQLPNPDLINSTTIKREYLWPQMQDGMIKMDMPNLKTLVSLLHST